MKVLRLRCMICLNKLAIPCLMVLVILDDAGNPSRGYWHPSRNPWSTVLKYELQYGWVSISHRIHGISISTYIYCIQKINQR